MSAARVRRRSFPALPILALGLAAYIGLIAIVRTSEPGPEPEAEAVPELDGRRTGKVVQPVPEDSPAEREVPAAPARSGTAEASDRSSHSPAAVAREPGPEETPPEPVPAELPAVVGQVVDASGNAVAGAHVLCAGERSTTDEEGRFRIAGDESFSAASPLRVLVPGRGLARGELGELESEGRPVVLDEGRSEFVGRLIDEEGRPLPEWRVIVHRAVVHEQVLGAGTTLDVGSLALTNAVGEFQLRDLLAAEEYELLAWNPIDLRSVRTPARRPTADGEAISIELAPNWRELSGRVVSRSGRPLSGLEISVTLAVPTGGGRSELFFGDSTVSGDEGEFVLRDVPREGVLLWVRGQGVLPARLEPQGGRRRREGTGERLSLEGVRLVAEEARELVVLSPVPDEFTSPPTHLGARDRSGRELPIVRGGRSSWRGARELELPAQGELRCWVALAATELLLLSRAEGESRVVARHVLGGGTAEAQVQFRP